ncbi:hypothetical protein [Opitutus sp. GAS368]|jgi:hypothetical protein|uniref:hypothetical protein n=1 Tax=Opitutus sp. GAS368 TaxID=1882749 RepID=UPI00087AA3A4|nr:hypothetical protein [Opitutus sp. GAS368]SDS32248.1 hypothetical protein SAMN05444173_2543 [Opitutus sp. GAS368]
MTTAEKSTAIIAAVNEYAAIYAAVKAPATPATFNDPIVQGMLKGFTEKIAAIIRDA